MCNCAAALSPPSFKWRELYNVVVEGSVKLFYWDYYTKKTNNSPNSCLFKTTGPSTIITHFKGHDPNVEKYFCSNPGCPNPGKGLKSDRSRTS